MYTEHRLLGYIGSCQSHCYRIEIPNACNNELKFTATKKMLQQLCVIYAGFESLLMINNEQRNFRTEKIHHQITCSFSMIRKVQCCTDTKPNYNNLLIRRSVYCFREFIEHVLVL